MLYIDRLLCKQEKKDRIKVPAESNPGNCFKAKREIEKTNSNTSGVCLNSLKGYCVVFQVVSGYIQIALRTQKNGRIPFARSGRVFICGSKITDRCFPCR